MALPGQQTLKPCSGSAVLDALVVGFSSVIRRISWSECGQSPMSAVDDVIMQHMRIATGPRIMETPAADRISVLSSVRDNPTEAGLILSAASPERWRRRISLSHR